MILIVTEKSSQVKEIVRGMKWRMVGIGAVGNLGGEDVKILPAKGHLLGLKDPDEVVPELRWDSLEYLADIPRTFEKRILKDAPVKKGVPKSAPTKDYFNNIKKALSECDKVIIAGDPDREGDLIVWEILKHLKCDKNKKVMRLLIHDTSESGIKRAFNNIIDGEASFKSAIAAEGRERSDWPFQHVTRAFTYFGRKGVFGPDVCAKKGKGSVASLGRVQTALLNMINERCEEIEKFQEINHYTVTANTKIGGIEIPSNYSPQVTQEIISKNLPWITWRESNSENTLDKPMFTDVLKVNSFIEKLKEKHNNFKVLNFSKKLIKRNPPKPFDLASANSEAAKRFKLKSKDSQSAIESLYLKGYTSYPRTEENEIPRDMYKDKERNSLFNSIESIPEFQTFTSYLKDLHNNKLNESPSTPSCFSNKGMAHYAIIPTDKKPNFLDMNSNEKKIYLMIVERFLLNFYPPAEYWQTKLSVIGDVEDMLENEKTIFESKSEVLVKPGYLNAFGKNSSSKAIEIPEIKEGTVVELKNIEKKDQKTTPPAYYNDNTIQMAMRDVGKRIKNTEHKKLLEGGLGRPATRVTILNLLLSREYIEDAKGKGYVLTNTGKAILKYAPEWMKSVITTAKMEGYLDEIAKASSIEKSIEMRDKFVNRYINNIVDTIKEMEKKYKGKIKMTSRKPSEKQLNFAKTIAKNLGIEVPEVAINDIGECSKFIEENKDSASKPTENQIKFAKKLAKDNGVELGNALSSYEACKDFIDKTLKSHPRKPSEKQISFAESLIERHSIEVEEGWKESYDKVQEIINKYANK